MPFAKVSRTTAKFCQIDVINLHINCIFCFCFCLLVGLQPFCPDVVCPLAAPYSTWIGSHNITMSWESLNQSDVVHILQWTGPSLSGIWEQAEVLNDFMFTICLMFNNYLLLLYIILY